MILFVDDLKQRYENFLLAFPDKQEVVHADTPEAACSALLRFDINEVWLDHDLGPQMWKPGSHIPTFFTVAQLLAGMQFKGKVYVHTGNPVASARIQDLLSGHNVHVMRPDGMTLACIWGGVEP